LRLLVLYQALDAAADHPGYYQGFERLVTEGALDAHCAIPVQGSALAIGWNGFWDEAASMATQMQADAIFLQFFHASMPDPTDAIRRLKSLPNKPVLFTSLGDPFGRWTNRIPRSFRVASALSDVSFLTGMGYLAEQLRRGGSNNLVLMPNGCCQVRFSDDLDAESSTSVFDIVFVGSRVRSRNPFSHYYHVAQKRVEFVQAFTKRYGKRFGLYGNGWAGNLSWQGPIPYTRQQDAYRKSAIGLGGMPNAYHDYYTSDRVFIAIASGTPFVDYWVKGVDRILQPGQDWWLANNQTDMFTLCDKLLDMSSGDRVQMGANARRHILAHHTQYHRCKDMIEIVKCVREAHLSGRKAPRPDLGFLSNSLSSNPPSIVAWEG
jgi:hypothetical protein